MQEIQRALANPRAAYYHTLMSGLFGQNVDQHTDYSYDLSAYGAATGVSLFSKELAHIRMRLVDLAQGVCRRHGRTPPPKKKNPLSLFSFFFVSFV